MEEPSVLSTRPPNLREKILQEKFYEHLAAQSDLMDKIAGQLLTVELAVPGLCAAVLKLVLGEKATVPLNAAAIAAFALWLVALIAALFALLPRRWEVDESLLRQAPDKMDEVLGIEDFYGRSAAYKYRLLWASSLLFLAGVLCFLLI